MIRITTFLCVWLWCWPLLGDAFAADPAIVNQAGLQRMLSQRMVKAWCQAALGLEPEHARRQMVEAREQFERNLRDLEERAHSVETKDAHRELSRAWQALRVSLEKEPRIVEALSLDRHGEAVLDAADRLTRAFESEQAVPQNRWINLAGRLRMLSQRLVKLYLLRRWWPQELTLRDEFERLRHEFGGILLALQGRPDNGPLLVAELDRLALEWEWLQSAFAAEGAGSYPLVVIESGEAVLHLADRITRLFEGG